MQCVAFYSLILPSLVQPSPVQYLTGPPCLQCEHDAAVVPGGLGVPGLRDQPRCRVQLRRGGRALQGINGIRAFLPPSFSSTKLSFLKAFIPSIFPLCKLSFLTAYPTPLLQDVLANTENSVDRLVELGQETYLCPRYTYVQYL